MDEYNRTTPRISPTTSTRSWATIVAACIALAGTAAYAQSVDWKVFVEPFVSAAHAQDVDWQKVDETLGRKPAVSGDVHRYGFPRTDLSVTLDGVTIKPALALGGWVAFKPMHGGVMAMGDLVLLETEINPVMAKMIAGGLEITAVHNHLLRATPATFYMHIAGHGDPAKIAATIHDALGESKTPLTIAAPSSPPPAVDLDTAQLDPSSASRVRTMAAFTPSTCRDAIPSAKAACSLRPSERWALRSPSTSSRPAAARPPSPATSS